MAGLVSGEGVALELERAGLGTRVFAAALDLAVQVGLLIVVVILDGLFANGDEDILRATFLVEIVLVFAGYPIVFEWLSRGKTLGKLAMGIRVVRDDGGPIGFRQALVRGLSSFVLEKPGIVVPILGISVGIITMGASSSQKRVGDMMAGTFVVNERIAPATALQEASWFVPPSLYGWAQSLDLSGVDDQLALRIRQFVVRAPHMTPGAQATLGARFAQQLLGLISPPPPLGVPASVLMTTVLAERRRRAELMAAPAGYPSYPPLHPAPPGAPSPAARPSGPGNHFTPPA